MRRLFPEREILLRSEGTLRFLKISSKVQIGIAAAAVVALMLWAAAAIFMLVGQYGVARDRAILDEQQAAIASSAKKVSTYRASVTETAKELEQRQEFLEDLVKCHFGDTLEDDKLIGPSKNKNPSNSGSKISTVIHGAHAIPQTKLENTT